MTAIPRSAAHYLRALRNPYLVLFLVVIAWAAAAHFLGLRTELLPYSDFAANDLLIYKAKSGQLLLHGNYSRVGVYHPGPFYIDVLALGEWLFHDLTPIARSPEGAHSLAIICLNAGLLAVTAAILADLTGRRLAAIAGVLGGLMVLIVNDPIVIASLWFPHIYMVSAFAFLTACAAVSVGRTKWLWFAIATGGMLVHGHASFVATVPITFILSIALSFLASRWRTHADTKSDVRNFLLMRRRDLLLGAIVAAPFISPIALNTLLNFPGEFGKYLAFQKEQSGHSVWEAVAYLSKYWGVFWIALPVLAASALPALSPKDAPSSKSADYRLGVAGAVVAVTIAAIYYVMTGVDSLSYGYIGLWYSAAPALVVAAAIVTAVAYAPKRFERDVAVLAAIVTLGGAVSLAKPPVHHPEMLTTIRTFTAAIKEYSGQTGRPVRLVLDNKSGVVEGRSAWEASWMLTAAMLSVMQREGGHWFCVTPETWDLLMGAEHQCPPDADPDTPVAGITLDVLVPAGSPVLAKGDGTSLFVLTDVHWPRSD